MVTLYAFGPAFGLPDPSPFVTKAEVLLKMADLDYTVDTVTRFKKAPKGKLPYLEDDGEIVGDSTFIRWHLEKKYAIDFDRGLDAEQRAIAWAFEKMLEDHLYWTVVHARWLDDANFAKGPRNFFRGVPAPMRPLVLAMVRRQIRRALYGHGMGRHSEDEIVALGTRSIDATATFLADNPFLMGDDPTGVDAAAFAFVSGILCPVFDSPLRDAAERRDNLKRYADRMAERFYPAQDAQAGQAA